jgi:hypothetical protein
MSLYRVVREAVQDREYRIRVVEDILDQAKRLGFPISEEKGSFEVEYIKFLQAQIDLLTGLEDEARID